MYEVTVERGFSSGHYLRNYKGKCENPHGHNYKVRITLCGDALDAAGLLLDFRELKHVMAPVIERIDHQMLNDLEPSDEDQSVGGEPGALFIGRDRSAS